MKILDTAMTEIVRGNSTRYYSKYVVDEKEHTDTLNNFKFQNMINPNNEITIGNTCSSSVTFSIYMPAISLENKEITIFEGVKVGKEINYIKLGIFTVTKQTSDGEYTSYEAYDRMYKADMPYFSDMAFPSTDKTILNEICGKLGISLATNIATAHTISDKPQGYTYREIIGYMAMLQGCNAVINSDGNLELRWYKDSDYVLDGHKYYQQGVTFTTSKDFIIQKLTCNNTKSGDKETSTITSGSGATGLSFANPFMTQAILDEVYKKIGGFTFRPLTVKFVGDYRLEVGDIITVNKNGVDYKVPIMQITHECDGGLMDTVTSIGQSDTENTSVASGPITKQMERYYADLVVINKALINKLDVDTAKITYATITNLNATNASIDSLKTNKLDATYADIINANVESLKAANAEITQLKANSLTADIADLKYAQIDFANVKGQVVTTSLIKDSAVTNEKVQSLSANKLTAGTIDASKITVTNLNADNITVGTINGKRIGTGSLSLDKLSEEVPTKEYLDKVQEELQGQIDGNIETFTKTEIPTLNNEPAVNWTDNATRKKHIGDICYVVNPTSSADGYSYRFANTGTEQAPAYEWVLIKDSDVTKALQDIININGEITGIKKFDVEISSWKTDTDSELSSLKTRTTNLETDMGNKVDTTTFNEVKQTVDENSSTITKMSETLSKKADSSTVTTLSNTVNSIKQTTDSNTSSISSLTTTVTKVESTASNANKTASEAKTVASNAAAEAANAKKSADESVTKVTALTNTVNSVKQTVDTNTSSISSMQTTIKNKADSSTVTALSNKTSELEQSLNGFKTTVSDTYATKTDLNTVDGKFVNYSTTAQMNSAITQSANKITNSVSATYTTKTEFNNLQIGGRNLALVSKTFESGSDKWSIGTGWSRSVDSNGFTIMSYSRSGATSVSWNRLIPHKYIMAEDMHKGIVVSFDFKCDSLANLDGGCICSLQNWTASNVRIGWVEHVNIKTMTGLTTDKPLKDGEWVRVSVPFPEKYLRLKLQNTSNDVAYSSVSFQLIKNGSIHIRKVKIEYGNKATDWSPAPEDIDEKFTDYSTTTQMNAAISTAISKESSAIKLEVSGAYATKDSLKSYATTASLEAYIKKDPATGELKSAIEAIADDITLNASGTINISGNKSVNINGNLFTLTSTNTTITADGKLICRNALIDGELSITRTTTLGTTNTSITGDGLITKQLWNQTLDCRGNIFDGINIYKTDAIYGIRLALSNDKIVFTTNKDSSVLTKYARLTPESLTFGSLETSNLVSLSSKGLTINGMYDIPATGLINQRITTSSNSLESFNKTWKIRRNGLLTISAAIWTDETNDYGIISCAIYIDNACVAANKHRLTTANAIEIDAGCSFSWVFNDNEEHELRIIAGSSKDGQKTITYSVQGSFGLAI